MQKQVNGHYDINPRVLFRDIHDEAVLLDVDTGQYFGLNSVGARIWQLLRSGCPAPEIRGQLVTEFEVSEDEAGRDLEAFLTDLLARNLITRAGNSNGAHP